MGGAIGTDSTAAAVPLFSKGRQNIVLSVFQSNKKIINQYIGDDTKAEAQSALGKQSTFLWNMDICSIAEILWKTASPPCKISL